MHQSMITLITLITVVFFLFVGCSDSNVTTTAKKGQPESNEPRAETIALEDGVYPVVPADAVVAPGDTERKTVQLEVISVPGDTEFLPSTMSVSHRPLVLFQDVSRFDFTFDNDECTRVGFENTDELRAYTRDHVGSKLAVVVGQKVISHHKIREAIDADQVPVTCCTEGGGDHLHRHLKGLARTGK